MGVHDLYVRNVEVVCPDLLGVCPFSGIMAGSLVDQAIAPSLIADLRIAFLPPELGPVSGVVKITSNDPNRPVVEIPIVGSGHQPPVPEVLVNDPENIEPLDQVVMMVEPPIVPWMVGIETYNWSLIRRPDGSTATFRDADQSECGIIADLAGDYTVELHVVDTMGVRSWIRQSLVRAIPADAWVHPIDLGSPYSRFRLTSHTTQPHSRRRPRRLYRLRPSLGCLLFQCSPDDWYQIQENHLKLDIDDQLGLDRRISTSGNRRKTPIRSGFTIGRQPEDARERRAPVEAVLRIYVMGLLQLETIPLDEDQTMWKALQMDWPDLNFRTLEESMPYARPF